MDLAASDSLAPILGELKLNIVLRNLITRLPVTQEITQHDDRMVQTFDYKRANGVITLTKVPNVSQRGDLISCKYGYKSGTDKSEHECKQEKLRNTRN